MSEELPGKITIYDPSMAAQVAQMFNDFDALWPGGFTGGIPFDAKRIHDWLDKTTAIADLIAVDDKGVPVGYCGLYPHWRDEGACYVTILGVVPRVKGGKFGKRLLLRAVELAQEKGMTRFDLHTWSGNLNAVPLYKKIGLFWVPETSVYMQNYIPALGQIGLAREWFDRHPDWYGCFQRALAQAPDKDVVDGMELYTYRFQAGDDVLVGEADRYGWGICGVERMLDGKRVALKTRLQAHDILIGIPNALTLIVENNTGQDMSLALTVEPFKGMQWLGEGFPGTVAVKNGETATLTRSFVVDKTAKTYRREGSEVIKTRLILGGQMVDLVTGGKIQPAVALSGQHAYLVTPAGSEAQVYFDLISHAKRALAGAVDVFVEGVAGSQGRIDFALEPEQVSGIVVPVQVPDVPHSPVLTIHAAPVIDVDGAAQTMPTCHLPVVVDMPDLAVVVPVREGDQLALLTESVDVHVDLEGGRIEMGRRTLPDIRRRARFEAGPPFGMGPDSTLKFDYEVQREGGALTLILSAESRQFPGLRIRKFARVAAGAREIEHWIELTNLQTGSAQTVGGRLHVGGGGGLSINPFGTVARSFTPIDGKVIECDGALPWLSENMLPQTPDHWPETWTALQTSANSDLIAWFWKPEGIKEISVGGGMLSDLESETRALKAGESFEVFHVWYAFGLSSLVDARHRWNQRVGHKVLPNHELRYGVTTIKPVEARWVGDNLVAVGQKSTKQIEIGFVTPYPLAGALSLNLPLGWEGAFLTPDGPQPTLPMPEPTPGAPARIEIELAAPADMADAAAAVQLHLSGEYEMSFDLPVLPVSKRQVRVEQIELEGKPVWAVDNGALSFKVMADVSGALIRLTDAQGRTFLDDNFPKVVPRFFVDHHVGGLQPMVFHEQDELPFAELETVDAQAVEEGLWQGVQVAWTVTHQEKLRGQRFVLQYLTLPGSELVRLKLTHCNLTPRRIDWVGGFFLNLLLQGAMEDTVLQAPGGTQAWTRNRVPKPFISQASLVDPWARAYKGDQSLTLLAPFGKNGAVVLADFFQVMGGFLIGVQETDAQAQTSVEWAIAVNQPVEAIKTLLVALSSI